MIYTVSQLKESLSNFKPSDTIYVMFWSKDEFEDNFDDKEITNKMWKQALETVDSEGEEQIVKETIEQEIYNLLEEKETA